MPLDELRGGLAHMVAAEDPGQRRVPNHNGPDSLSGAGAVPVRDAEPPRRYGISVTVTSPGTTLNCWSFAGDALATTSPAPFTIRYPHTTGVSYAL